MYIDLEKKQQLWWNFVWIEENWQYNEKKSCAYFYTSGFSKVFYRNEKKWQTYYSKNMVATFLII